MRHVVQAEAIINIRIEIRRSRNVVVVVDDARRGGERQIVAGAELSNLVVLRDAVRVAEAASPHARRSLAQLEHGGVVVGMRVGRGHRDGVQPVLGIRHEQRVQLHLPLGGERPGARYAEKRVVDERRELTAEREIFDRQLIEVDRGIVVEMVAVRPDIPDDDAHVARKLALHVHRVLLHPRRRGVRIEKADAAAHTRRQAECVARRLEQHSWKRVVDARDRNIRVLHHRCRLRVAGREHRAVVPRCPIQPVSAAQHGLTIDVEHDAGARRQLERGRLALFRGRAVRACIDEPALHLPRFRMQRIEARRNRHVQRTDGARVESDDEVVVLLREAGLVLQPQTVIEREP